MDFADVTSGKYTHFGAARNSCAAAGVAPANGLVYSFPHACGCYPMLRGMLALDSTPTDAASQQTAGSPQTDIDIEKQRQEMSNEGPPGMKEAKEVKGAKGVKGATKAERQMLPRRRAIGAHIEATRNEPAPNRKTVPANSSCSGAVNSSASQWTTLSSGSGISARVRGFHR